MNQDEMWPFLYLPTGERGMFHTNPSSNWLFVWSSACPTQRINTLLNEEKERMVGFVPNEEILYSVSI